MIFFACVVCKATHCLLRLLGFGATSLPGVLALRVCPDVLEFAARGVEIIAVTGTNGKTTSCRIAERAMQSLGEVSANRSGANLRAGIAAQLILNRGLLGGVKCPRAVIECDEAACRTVLGEIKPRVLLVTNLFRDQLDRYGELKYPRDCIAEGLSAAPETTAVINADCPMAASIARLAGNRVVWFGVSDMRRFTVGSGEDGNCPLCLSKLSYKRVSYASLGEYSCRCGFARPSPDFTAVPLDGGGVGIKAPSGTYFCAPALPGLYNVYNAAGAFAAAVTAGCDENSAAAAAESFDAGFGRMEKFSLGKGGAKMILIKNAAAADRTIEQICADKRDKAVVLAVNARTADGTDVSWLDDADFGALARCRGLKKVFVCGECAEAVGKRLKKEKISYQYCENYDKLIRELDGEESFIFLLPTYTAMLELRKKLVLKLGGKNFWE